ncbi:MAG: hypothetical protein QXX35_02245 [Desulfurococcaceae archaeon]
MKLEASYLSIVLVLLITMLLTSSFINLINHSVSNIKNTLSGSSNNGECIYIFKQDSVKIVLINRTCMNGSVVYIDTDIGEIYSNEEFSLIKTYSDKSIRIITREEIVIV